MEGDRSEPPNEVWVPPNCKKDSRDAYDNFGSGLPMGDKNGTLIGMNRLRVTLNLGAYRVAKNVFRVFIMCFVNFSGYN
jgi:hypothetical protein